MFTKIMVRVTEFNKLGLYNSINLLNAFLLTFSFVYSFARWNFPTQNMNSVKMCN